MDARAALLRAIIEEPDDDAHRLVFADWLEDDGKREWATLIRAQCTLHALMLLPPDDPYQDHRLVPLGYLTAPVRKQILELLPGLFDDGWLGDGQPARPQFLWKMHRGMPEYLEVWGESGVRAFIARASIGLEQMPLCDLVLRSHPVHRGRTVWDAHSRVETASLARLLCVPVLARVRNVDLRGVSIAGLGEPAHAETIRKASKTLRQTRIWVNPDTWYESAEQARLALRREFGERLIIAPAYTDNPSGEDIPF